MAMPLASWSQTETVLYSFGTPGNYDGYYPGPLLVAAAGNFFGMASAGGTAVLCPDPTGLNACGTVFELAQSSGNYTQQTLYSFTGPPDGDGPGDGLIGDSAGNLYGTTSYGGNYDEIGSFGIVFELVKSSSGYAEKVLYRFSGPDGAIPLAGLIMDSAGNLYGTTYQGGAYGYGTVFELVNSSGTYTEKVLYNFAESSSGGQSPRGNLIIDSAENLYGTTEEGGDLTACGGYGCGTVFELVNSPTGYTPKLLYGFKGSDGNAPLAGLTMDASGDLYGTTQAGGANNYGAVFELVNSSGNYTGKVLYSFAGLSSGDGQAPMSALLLDPAGNLYGATPYGGSGCMDQGCGTVFELVNSSGTYTERLLHNFGAAGDGIGPGGPLVMDSAGKLYGTTLNGGAYQLGTLFTIDPAAPAPAVTLSASSLAFGYQQLNTSSPAQTIAVTNSGKANLIFGAGALTLSGTDSSFFVIGADGCSGATIAPGGTCPVSVSFAPPAAGAPGADSATLTFSDNAPSALQTVSFTGTGVPAGGPWVVLSSTSLTFPPQPVGTISGAQTVTLTNSGFGPLNISGISVTDDGNQTNNCGSSVAVGSSCTFSVSFSPSVTVQEYGDIFIWDNAYDDPQTIKLSGAGVAGTEMDFTVGMAAGSSQSAAVAPGASASYSLSVAPLGGFKGAVTLACVGAPALAACTVSPAALTLDGANAVAVAVSVTTDASALAVRHEVNSPGSPATAVLVALLGLACPLTLWRQGRGKRRKAWTISLAALAVTATFGLACGGGGSNAGSGAPSASGTPAGTYTLTVTGSSGTLAHSIALKLAVN
jgi:uncharacterized repeat protein (TIGR03803 family)